MQVSIPLQHFLNPKNTTKAVHKTMVTGAALLKRHANQHVPVDTGNLKRSIHANTNGRRIIFEARAEYAGYVEFGTSRMAPRGYMLPAVAAVLPELMQRLGQDIVEGTA